MTHHHTNAPSSDLNGKDSSSAEIRNDPTYRANRRAKFTEAIAAARSEGKKLLLTVSRVDTDVLKVAEETNIPVLDHTPDAEKHPICFWNPPGYIPTMPPCNNPICAYRSPDAKRCRRCKAVYYCSVLCQRVHWPTHRENCVEKEQSKAP